MRIKLVSRHETIHVTLAILTLMANRYNMNTLQKN